MNNSLFSYPFQIQPLTKEEGGGYLISFPDFNECISDGETPEEAIRNGFDALQETIYALKDMGLAIPQPFSTEKKSDSFVQNLPKHLYKRLEVLAKKKKVSVKRLINLMLEESLQKKETDVAS